MSEYNQNLGYLMRGRKEFCHEGFTVSTETLRQMQNRKAQRQSIHYLRKSKAQTATGIVDYGKN
jgi:hypothetical protein